MLVLDVKTVALATSHSRCVDLREHQQLKGNTWTMLYQNNCPLEL